MKNDAPLKPDDFPIEAENETLKAHKAQKVAEADLKELAEHIAERLNDHAYQEEQDCWAA